MISRQGSLIKMCAEPIDLVCICVHEGLKSLRFFKEVHAAISEGYCKAFLCRFSGKKYSITAGSLRSHCTVLNINHVIMKSRHLGGGKAAIRIVCPRA